MGGVLWFYPVRALFKKCFTEILFLGYSIQRTLYENEETRHSDFGPPLIRAPSPRLGADRPHPIGPDGPLNMAGDAACHRARHPKRPPATVHPALEPC